MAEELRLVADTTPSAMTDWNNEPTLKDLQDDFTRAQADKDAHLSKLDIWLNNLYVQGTARPPKRINRSTVQPKLIRKNNEWRYPSLSEPFLNTTDVFRVQPRTFEDTQAAKQNELLLNYQFNNKIDKVAFFDSVVRDIVDKGTVFIRTGWKYEEQTVTRDKPIFGLRPAQTEDEAMMLQKAAQGIFPIIYDLPDADDNYKKDLRGENTEQWIAALQASEQQQMPIVPYQTGTEQAEETIVLVNHPTVDVVPHSNLTIDPSCNGDLKKANFIVYSFETSIAELEAEGIYKNLDEIPISQMSVLDAEHHESSTDSGFNFADEPRKKFVAHEYWGYWDIHGNGRLEPIVATWVNNIWIRMEINPYPDKELPFTSIKYMPVDRSSYGEPDAELIEENQKIIGAVTRGMIDLLARSANSQRGMRKDMLDVINKRKYNNGEDYEFNQSVDARQGVVEHTYPEIPQSAVYMVQSNTVEAETITGVRPYGPTNSSDISNNASATKTRGILDAASKREISILRRVAEGVKQIGYKIITMNSEFLEDSEIIRVTNQNFVEIKREGLLGNFDINLSISTAEEDNAKAEELAFMLQTVGPNSPPELFNMVAADISDLRKMPELAEKLRTYKPEPDPIQQALAQEEVRKAQLENAKIEAEIAKIYADAGLTQEKTGTEGAKQRNLDADSDRKDLDYVEQESGVNHERNLEQDGAQARANLMRDLIKARVDAQNKQVQSLQPKGNS